MSQDKKDRLTPEDIAAAYRHFGIDRAIIFEIALDLIPQKMRTLAHVRNALTRALDEKIVKFSKMEKPSSFFGLNSCSLLALMRVGNPGLSKKVLSVLQQEDEKGSENPSVEKDFFALDQCDFPGLLRIENLGLEAFMGIIALRAILDVTGRFARSPVSTRDYCETRKSIFHFIATAQEASDPDPMASNLADHLAGPEGPARWARIREAIKFTS